MTSSSTRGKFKYTYQLSQVIWVLTKTFFYSLAPAHELVVTVGLFRRAELLSLCFFFKNKKKKSEVNNLYPPHNRKLFGVIQNTVEPKSH